MNRALPRLGLCGLLVLAAFSGCGIDDRALVFEYSKLDSAGSAATAGRETAGASNTAPAVVAGSLQDSGDSGLPGAGSGGSIASGGTQAEAGAAAEQGGTLAAGGTASSAGVAGTATGGSATAGSAVSAGTGGAAVSFACGDLNQDLVDDCSQTLVQNSRFDASVSGWDSEPSTSQGWDSSDASGKSGSGSVKVSNTAAMVPAVGSIIAGSRQCIAVTPTTNYDFAARVMLAAGETNGRAGVNVWLFDDDACQGNLVIGNTPIEGGVAGSWSVLKGNLWVPGGVHSMYVRLVAIKPFVQPALSVLMDDILVAER